MAGHPIRGWSSDWSYGHNDNSWLGTSIEQADTAKLRAKYMANNVVMSAGKRSCPDIYLLSVICYLLARSSLGLLHSAFLECRKGLRAPWMPTSRQQAAIVATASLVGALIIIRARIRAYALRRSSQRENSTYWDEHSMVHDPRGFFGIGICMGKTQGNLGTLWRSAYQLGAAFTFTVGARHAKLKTDTANCWQHLPAHQYTDFEAYTSSAPFGCQLVAIEMGGSDLRSFRHPSRAIYLLGAEDNGLPAHILKACHHRISIPSARTESFNVAVSGSLVMYDRLCKQQHEEQQASSAAPLAAAASIAYHLPHDVSPPTPLPTKPQEDRTQASAEVPQCSPPPMAPPAAKPSTPSSKASAHPAPPRSTSLADTLRAALSGSNGGSAANGGGLTLLAVRCARVFKSRVVAYLALAPYACEQYASSGEYLFFSARDPDDACARIHADPNLRRAIGASYILQSAAPSAVALAQAVASHPAVRDAPGVCVRLSVYPREVRTELEGCLPSEMRLQPRGHSAILHALKLTAGKMTSSTSASQTKASDGAEGVEALYAWSLRPLGPDVSAHGTKGDAAGEQDLVSEAHRRLGFDVTTPALLVVDASQPVPKTLAATRERGGAGVTRVVPAGKALLLDDAHAHCPADGFASAAVLLDADHERLATLLCDALPPLLHANAPLLVSVPMPREGRGTAGDFALSRLAQCLAAAGYEEVKLPLPWLFANGPAQRTLCCRWGGATLQ